MKQNFGGKLSNFHSNQLSEALKLEESQQIIKLEATIV
jgi:hypothetical protein